MFAKWIVAVFSMLFWGCSLYEYEADEGYHSWRFVGLQNDSIAVVKVSYLEQGHIHDNHLMGWEDGEPFEITISEYYYPVKMTSYWIGDRESSVEALLPEPRTKLPDWVSGCLAAEYVGKDAYCINRVELDNYGACAFVISQKKSILDSLEISRCDGLDAEGQVKISSNYLKLDKSFYSIVDGKFPSQRPALRYVEGKGSIKFIDRNGDYIVYGGMP